MVNRKNSRLPLPGELQNLPRGKWDGSEWEANDGVIKRGKFVSPNKALEQAVVEYAEALHVTVPQLMETAMKAYLLGVGYDWWAGPLDKP